MRVLLAGCFVFGTMALVALLVGNLIPKAHPSLIAVVSVETMLGPFFSPSGCSIGPAFIRSA